MASNPELDIIKGRLKTIKKIIPGDDPTCRELAQIVEDLVDVLNHKEAGFKLDKDKK